MCTFVVCVMAHHHHHGHTHGDSGTKNIVVAFWVNTVFAILEIFGGLYTNSMAIISDALHDLGDSLSLGLAWFFQRKSEKKRDRDFSYGYGRFSLLGVFVNSLILIVGALVVIYESSFRLMNPVQPDAQGMFILALIGLGVNLFAMLRLRRGQSINEKVVSLHFMEDVLGWAAVLAGSVIMMFADVPVLDPVLSIAIAMYILYNVYGNAKHAIRIVLQARPEHLDEEKIRSKLLTIAGVMDVHDLHFWTLDGKYNVLTLHAVVDERIRGEAAEAIKKQIRAHLHDMDVQHATIEIETGDSDCRLRDC